MLFSLRQEANQTSNEMDLNSHDNPPQLLVFMTKLCHNTGEGDLRTFQLIPTITALENVMVPLEFRGENQASQWAVVAQLLQAQGAPALEQVPMEVLRSEI
jgi:hypothetical protein